MQVLESRNFSWVSGTFIRWCRACERPEHNVKKWKLKKKNKANNCDSCKCQYFDLLGIIITI